MPRALICLLFGMLLFSFPADAQKKKKKKDVEVSVPEKPEKKEPKKVSEAIKDMKAIPGLFELYRDTVTGSIKMVILDRQLNEEYIHWFYIENGVNEAGLGRGQFRGTRVVRLEKYYNKINFILLNTSSYFNPENPLSRAAEANLSKSVLHSAKIDAGSEAEGRYLIEADPLFLKEVFGVVDRTYLRKDPGAFKL